VEEIRSFATAQRRGRSGRKSKRTQPGGVSAAGLTPRDDILRDVAAIVQQVLGAAVPPDQPLMEAGLDSLGGGGSLVCILSGCTCRSTVCRNAGCQVASF